jgi:hypothetical protein
MKHDEELWNMSTIDKVAMNLLRMFNRGIYETIYTFMKTRPIFQPPHSRGFMNQIDDVCSPVLKKTKSIIAGGEGTLMCEVYLDPQPMYTMFNVDDNMISNPTTPTTNLNKPTTLTILTNSLATLTMLFEH